MLSRHGKLQPIPDFNARHYTAKTSFDKNRNDQATPTNFLSEPPYLCKPCMRIPFGPDASQIWKDSWSRSAAVRGTLIIDYEKNIQEIKYGVSEKCRWCTMLANAILLAVNLDASYEAMAELNASSVSGNDEEEDDEEEDENEDMVVCVEDTEQTEDQALTLGVEEGLSDEEFLPKRDEMTNQYDDFDVFDRCEISMTYLDDSALVGEPTKYTKLRVSADIYALDAGPDSIGLIGHKSVEVEFEVFSDGE